MEVSSRRDCIAMDKVKNKGSLPLFFYGNMYILTIIDCFTRYAIAVPLPNQSAESFVNAIIEVILRCTALSVEYSLIKEQIFSQSCFSIFAKSFEFIKSERLVICLNTME